MTTRKEISNFLEYEALSPEEIDLALRQLIEKGLLEVGFNNEDFCFVPTEKGIIHAGLMRGKEERGDEDL
tara:strand:+ start:174 stop:383 length:210 start_codon:yes stop_codon:yes gene_type:complete